MFHWKVDAECLTKDTPVAFDGPVAIESAVRCNVGCVEIVKYLHS